MSNLFQISDELIALRNQLEVENEFADESPEKEEIEKALEIKRGELVEKVEGYLHVISTVDAQASMGQDELKRIQTFIERKQHIAERLRASLLQALLLFGEEDNKGVKRLEIGTHRLSTRRSKSVNILDSDKVTDDCKQVDVIFKNLTPEIAKFLKKRIDDLPESVAKPILQEAVDDKIKISKTLIKGKIEAEDVDWAEMETKYGLTIK